jgi:hypothetical protein
MIMGTFDNLMIEIVIFVNYFQVELIQNYELF